MFSPLSPPLPKNEWTTVRIRQFSEDDVKYTFSIEIGGEKFVEMENKDARNFKNVTFMNGADMYPPAKAYIDNISFQTTGQFFIHILYR